MWVDVLEELPGSSRQRESGLPIRLPAGPVYKFPGGMIEKVRSVVPVGTGLPARRMLPLIDRRLRYGAGLVLSLLAVIGQVRSAPQLQSSDFDFSIYFTGNVRGNLEPCG